MSALRSPASRRRQVIDLLSTREGPVGTDDLSAELGVSVVTMRRDLDSLEQSGQIIRTHGGAMINSQRPERSIPERQDTNALAKAEIAVAAARLVQPGMTVLLDAGTTTSRLAAELAGISGLTIVTTGVNVLGVLASSDTDATIICAGGTLRKVNQTLLGPFAVSVVSSVYADIAFVGSDCVDLRRGVSSRTPEQNAMKALMIRQARRPIIVADSSKLATNWATHWFMPPAGVELLTDSGATDEVLAPFLEAEAWDVLTAGADALSDSARSSRPNSQGVA